MTEHDQSQCPRCGEPLGSFGSCPACRPNGASFAETPAWPRREPAYASYPLAQAPRETQRVEYTASAASSMVNDASVHEAPTAPLPRVELEQRAPGSAVAGSSGYAQADALPAWPPRHDVDSTDGLAQGQQETPPVEPAPAAESIGLLEQPAEDAPAADVSAAAASAADVSDAPAEECELPVWPPRHVSEPHLPESNGSVDEVVDEASDAPVPEPEAEVESAEDTSASADPVPQRDEAVLGWQPSRPVHEPWPASSSKSHRVTFACLAAVVGLILFFARRDHRR